MAPKLGLIFLVFALFFCNTHAKQNARPEKSLQLLSRILSSKSKNPLVVLVDVDHRHKRGDFDDLLSYSKNDELIHDNEDEEERNRREEREEKAYYLYHLLRSSPDQPSNSAEARSLDKTRQYLRQALVARCQKVNICVKLCPKKKKSCPKKCKETFDDLEVCDEPKCDSCEETPKCGESKCGNRW